MGRWKGIEGQWSLLAVALLIGAGLALHEQAAEPEETAYGAHVYSMPRVLEGDRLHPQQWEHDPVLVRGTFYRSCDAPGGVPCAYPASGAWPWTVLYDGRSRAFLPRMEPMRPLCGRVVPP